jgi:hypothetical protein
MAESSTSGPRFPTALRGIYVRSASFKLLGDIDPLDPGQVLFGENLIVRQIFADSRHGNDSPVGILYVTTFKFAYRREAPSDKQETPSVAEVEGDIACDVAGLPDNFTQREREVFGVTGVLNVCWPYWRELVQSSMTRMGLPAAVLPPMNFASIGDRATAAE